MNYPEHAYYIAYSVPAIPTDDGPIPDPMGAMACGLYSADSMRIIAKRPNIDYLVGFTVLPFTLPYAWDGDEDALIVSLGFKRT